jgi:hypothetical protein
MRLECTRPGSPIKWCDVDIIASGKKNNSGIELFSVVLSHGIKDLNDEEKIVKPLHEEFLGTWQEANDILQNNVQYRTEIGYLPVNKTQEE